MGYLSVSLNINKNKKTFRIHRLVAISFIPNPENKPQVNHKNGNKQSNYVSNLECNTSKENINHSYGTGLQKALKGEKSHRSKLTEKQVLEIRGMEGKIRNFEIATLYGMSQQSIGSILKRINWKHI